LSYRGKAGEV